MKSDPNNVLSSQLGLTFTVPFLTIPLNDLLGGGGLSGLSNLGGLGDLFNLGSGNLITIAVIALGAIFVLPQLIYWLTGINLSAFNWGRSEYFTRGKSFLACNALSVKNLIHTCIRM